MSHSNHHHQQSHAHFHEDDKEGPKPEFSGAGYSNKRFSAEGYSNERFNVDALDEEDEPDDEPDDEVDDEPDDEPDDDQNKNVSDDDSLEPQHHSHTSNECPYGSSFSGQGPDEYFSNENYENSSFHRPSFAPQHEVFNEDDQMYPDADMVVPTHALENNYADELPPGILHESMSTQTVESKKPYKKNSMIKKCLDVSDVTKNYFGEFCLSKKHNRYRHEIPTRDYGFIPPCRSMSVEPLILNYLKSMENQGKCPSAATLPKCYPKLNSCIPMSVSEIQNRQNLLRLYGKPPVEVHCYNPYAEKQDMMEGIDEVDELSYCTNEFPEVNACHNINDFNPNYQEPNDSLGSDGSFSVCIEPEQPRALKSCLCKREPQESLYEYQQRGSLRGGGLGSRNCACNKKVRLNPCFYNRPPSINEVYEGDSQNYYSGTRDSRSRRSSTGNENFRRGSFKPCECGSFEENRNSHSYDNKKNSSILRALRNERRSSASQNSQGGRYGSSTSVNGFDEAYKMSQNFNNIRSSSTFRDFKNGKSFTSSSSQRRSLKPGSILYGSGTVAYGSEEAYKRSSSLGNKKTSCNLCDCNDLAYGSGNKMQTNSCCPCKKDENESFNLCCCGETKKKEVKERSRSHGDLSCSCTTKKPTTPSCTICCCKIGKTKSIGELYRNSSAREINPNRFSCTCSCQKIGKRKSQSEISTNNKLKCGCCNASSSSSKSSISGSNSDLQKTCKCCCKNEKKPNLCFCKGVQTPFQCNCQKSGRKKSQSEIFTSQQQNSKGKCNCCNAVSSSSSKSSTSGSDSFLQKAGKCCRNLKKANIKPPCSNPKLPFRIEFDESENQVPTITVCLGKEAQIRTCSKIKSSFADQEDLTELKKASFETRSENRSILTGTDDLFYECQNQQNSSLIGSAGGVHRLTDPACNSYHSVCTSTNFLSKDKSLQAVSKSNERQLSFGKGSVENKDGIPIVFCNHKCPLISQNLYQEPLEVHSCNPFYVPTSEPVTESQLRVRCNGSDVNILYTSNLMADCCNQTTNTQDYCCSATLLLGSKGDRRSIGSECSDSVTINEINVPVLKDQEIKVAQTKHKTKINIVSRKNSKEKLKKDTKIYCCDSLGTPKLPPCLEKLRPKCECFKEEEKSSSEGCKCGKCRCTCKDNSGEVAKKTKCRCSSENSDEVFSEAKKKGNQEKKMAGCAGSMRTKCKYVVVNSKGEVVPEAGTSGKKARKTSSNELYRAFLKRAEVVFLVLAIIFYVFIYKVLTSYAL